MKKNFFFDFLKKLYRIIIFNFFFLIYGKIKKPSNFNNKNYKINKINIRGNIYKIYILNKARLYTDNIHNIAYIINNSIIKGPSIQIKNFINAKPEENIVLKKGTPRFKKNFKGTVASFLVGGAGNSNYWHWILDIIPKFKIIAELKSEIDFFLVPNNQYNFQKETLKALGIPESKLIYSRKYHHISADKIISIDHPYNLTNNPKYDHLNIPNWIFFFLKKKFFHLIKKNKKKFPSKFYIDRSDAPAIANKYRFIINEVELKNILLEKNYSLIKLSELSFIDQITLFNRAKSIVGLHGAGFANIIFCNKKTKILELKPSSAGNIIKNLALKNKLLYQDISVAPKTINFNNQAGDIFIKLDILKNKI